MSDIHAQLVAVIAGIKSRTKHGPGCEYVHGGMCAGCDCDWVERVDAEIAETFERMAVAAMHGAMWCETSHGHSPTIPEGWRFAFGSAAVRAAFREATEPDELTHQEKEFYGD